MGRSNQRPRRGRSDLGTSDKAARGADTPAGRALGLDDRDIPGGKEHIVNPQTTPDPTALEPPAQLFADGSLLDHGVPDPSSEPGWDKTPGHVYQLPRAAPEPEVSDAVPVYMVPGPGGTQLESSPRAQIVPAFGAVPVRLCGRDKARVSVLLLNEDTAIHVRLGASEVEAASGGAKLAAAATGYLRIHTKGSLYAVADSGTATVKVSVIEEFGSGQE